MSFGAALLISCGLAGLSKVKLMRSNNVLLAIAVSTALTLSSVASARVPPPAERAELDDEYLEVICSSLQLLFDHNYARATEMIARGEFGTPEFNALIKQMKEDMTNWEESGCPAQYGSIHDLWRVAIPGDLDGFFRRVQLMRAATVDAPLGDGGGADDSPGPTPPGGGVIGPPPGPVLGSSDGSAGSSDCRLCVD